jgi:hypothetical protein
MKIAYIISAYNYPSLLVRLVHRLHTPTSVFLIHIDKRTANHQYQEMTSGVADFSNVVFLRRHNCHWGDFGHVRATLKGLRYLFENKIDFDYLLLLTGQDYPIKSNSYIDSFLSHANGQQFISYYSFPNKAWGENGGMRRIEQWHFRFLEDLPFRALDVFVHLPLNRESTSKTKAIINSLVNRMFSKREFPCNIRPFGGPGYWVISRGCAEYIDKFASDHPDFVQFFKYADIPDEIFFHTIIMNSSFAGNVVNDDLRCIDILGARGPRIWRKADLHLLAQSRALIARKFDPTVDTEILDLIDAQLLGAHSCSQASF